VDQGTLLFHHALQAVRDQAVFVCRYEHEIPDRLRILGFAREHTFLRLVVSQDLVESVFNVRPVQRRTKPTWCGARDQGDVWFIKKPVSNDLHPTMKPVELVELALRNSRKTRDTVLDPFGGSGTTLIACERTGRQARLIEMEPRYCDVIVRRWQEHTGQLATLEADGRTFQELATERLGMAA